ncbi:MAG: cysteine desulfurase [bacterium]|nr:cysteine desulfurase [bacterium]
MSRTKDLRVPSKLDVEAVRRDFPILGREVHGKPLVYLDSAASSQKPNQVIDAISDYYRNSHSNVHRGVHALAEEATNAYELARTKVQRFLRAESEREVVFVRGTTEALNLVAQAYARPMLTAGDEVLLTEMEHHSNIVPWQIVCEQTGAKLIVAPIDDRGQLIIEEFERLLNSRTKIVTLTHVSNSLGTVNPLTELIALAKERGATVIIDGAQAVPHLAVDVRKLGCDFYAFSGHKMYGPTGIGVLWGRRELLDGMEPYQSGGHMIVQVSFEGTSYAASPSRFEAGTPNISGAVGLGAAIDYLTDLGLDAVEAHENALLQYGIERLETIPEIRLIGRADQHAGVLSFLVGDIHAHDVGTIVDSEGVAVRAGHHCSQPVMDHFKVAATSRASLAVHNDRDDIDRLVDAIQRVLEIFG